MVRVGVAVSVLVAHVVQYQAMLSAFQWRFVRILCRSSRPVAARVCAGHDGRRGSRRPGASGRRCAAPHHDHRRLLLPSYLREPWGGILPPMPGCVWFHAVTSGRCELIVDGDRLELQPGDLALVPHGTGHVIEAGDPSEYPSIPDLPHEEQSDNYAVLRYGDDGPLTELVCGGLRFEHPSARRLLDGLPPVVHVRTVRRTAVGATLDLLADEVHTPRGRQRSGDQPVVRHPRDPGHPPLDDQ